MKKGIKTITKTVEIFVAEDGKEFFAEDECIAYEVEQSLNEIPMFEKIVVNGYTSYKRTNSLDETDIICISTEEELENCKNYGEYFGYDVPNSIGIFFCDIYSGWVRIDTIYDLLKREGILK